MKIRLATLEDIPQISDLLMLLFSQESEFIPNEKNQEKGLKTIINNPTVGNILVIEKSNEIIATINLLYSVSTALGAKVAILEDMIVKSTMQKSGVGSLLIKHAIEFAKEQGCKRITLLTDKDNLQAHNFYLKNGFTQSDMIPFRLLFDTWYLNHFKKQHSCDNQFPLYLSKVKLIK